MLLQLLKIRYTAANRDFLHGISDFERRAFHTASDARVVVARDNHHLVGRFRRKGRWGKVNRCLRVNSHDLS